jgi:hypothetical protein
MKVSFIIG